MPDRKAHTVQAEASLTWDGGVLTICGVCGNVASQHRKGDVERETILLCFRRTGECKHCGENVWDVEWCPEKQREHHTNDSKRAPRKKKVAACRECAAIPEHIVEPSEWEVSPAEFVEAWRQELARRGLL